MLKNYFKIAIAVLKRRKFFTFISLFGISFTLTILIVLAAFMDQIFGSNYPEVNRDRSLYIPFIIEKSKDGTERSQNTPSFLFFNKYVKRLKTPEKIAITSNLVSMSTIVNSKKIGIDVRHTNADFWRTMNFEFIEGKPYNQTQVKNGEKIVIITLHTKEQYFGNARSVVGRYIECDHMQYKVQGVVKNVPITMLFTYADMYLPYTVSEAYKEDTTIIGRLSGYQCILLAHSKSDLPKIREEYKTILAKVPARDLKMRPEIFSNADPYFVMFTRELFGDEGDSGLRKYYTMAIIVLLTLVLLPIFNLVNINISRIMERSSEIGIRKAFGASSQTLVFQFLVENLILTFIGGLLSIMFSSLILGVINSSNFIPHSELVLNKSLLLYSLLMFFIFGIFSGVYPAWRMSRMNVVNALKA